MQGKRAQSDSSRIPEGHLRLARSRTKERATGRAGDDFRPASAVTSRSKRRRTEKSSPVSTAIRSVWERSAPERRSARKTLRIGLPLSLGCVRRRTYRQSDRSADPAIGRARPIGVSPRALAQRRGPGRYRTAGSRLLAANAEARQTPTRSCLSRFAYMRRRGDEMVLESPRAGALVQNLRSEDRGQPSPCSSTPQQIKQLRRMDGFPGVAFLALLVDCQIAVQGRNRRRKRPSTRPRATTTSCFGTFTIFSSTRAAPKAGTPIRSGGVYPYAGVDFSAAGGAAALARKKNRSAQVRGGAFGGDLAGRKAPARPSFDAQL